MYFEVHQPMRLNHFSVFNIGDHNDPKTSYFDEKLNREIFEKVARKCYLPTNNLLLELIRKHDGEFRVSFSLTGTFVEYCERYMPEVLDSFKELFKTGSVDMIEETYYHSLSALYDDMDEFEDQVKMHNQMIRRVFNYRPRVFRNTEAIFDNRIAKKVADMGYKGIITEGTDKILNWRSPNYLYRPVNADIKVLLRNYTLSDDVGFRFSAKQWPGHPLTADKYAQWMIEEKEEIINLFMDYETFGEHQWEDTGIFDFMKALPAKVLSETDFVFSKPKDVVRNMEAVDAVHVPNPISWADEERDLTAWLGNDMQDEAFEKLYSMEEKVRSCKDAELLMNWNYLQASDHFYYMCT
ncbi:glycoside hydrolase family 57 protein, partial [bacterium]|nr:glycoside hydrolase family 57 protein [bacterium]